LSVLLNEPLAALDEDSALAYPQVLSTLPVEHSFVMTIHNASPKIASMFDRMIHFDGKETCRMIERKGPATVPAFITESTQDKNMHITYRGIVLSIYPYCMSW